ncbi:MAG: ArsR/SmtB family transcription factor [Flavobacteriales bacterium]
MGEEREIRLLINAAEMMKAVAHPVRMQIISLLQKNKNLSVSRLQEILNIEQAIVSQHLAVMKKKGVLVCRREGKNAFYSIKNPLLTRIVDDVKKCQDCE